MNRAIGALWLIEIHYGGMELPDIVRKTRGLIAHDRFLERRLRQRISK